MKSERFKTLIGIQGSVMGWDDPWHYKLCGSKMRTGERMQFPSQDSRPSPDEFISFIKSLGVDFYLHQAMPDENEINCFIDSIEKLDISYFLGNEYGTINKGCDGVNNRYDFSKKVVDKAKDIGNFLGLFYDETEHLQLHPEIYSNNQPEKCAGKVSHQWTSTKDKTLLEIENDVCLSVRKIVENYGGDVPLYSEQVFPVMYHTLARGGMNLCPKVLKEEFQSLQLSTALGAARQYNRKMGICVDLWGPDVGPWFTRVWGFPGHSSKEYKSGLEIAYLMGVDFLFTENIDPLAIHTNNGFRKTEFGDIFEEFIKKFVPENPINYNHSMVDPDIVIIRSDDTDWNSDGGFFGRGLYGSTTLKSNFKTSSVFQIFNLLSFGKIPVNGLTFWLDQYKFPSSTFSRTSETLKSLPLIHGVEKENQTSVHDLFYPMNNVAVFDERVDINTIGNPKLIFLAGSRITDSCMKAISQRVREGSICVAAKWLIPNKHEKTIKDGMGKWVIIEDFSSKEVQESVDTLTGDKDCWMQRFGNYELRFYNPNNDGVTLTHEIKQVK